MDTRKFFRSVQPPKKAEHALYVRIGNALYRAGIKTMDDLCGLSEGEISSIRNMGEKGLKAAMRERERYLATREGKE